VERKESIFLMVFESNEFFLTEPISSRNKLSVCMLYSEEETKRIKIWHRGFNKA
jgi:hypothetical protein